MDIAILGTVAYYKQLGTAFSRLEDEKYAGLRKELDLKIIRR